MQHQQIQSLFCNTQFGPFRLGIYTGVKFNRLRLWICYDTLRNITNPQYQQKHTLCMKCFSVPLALLAASRVWCVSRPSWC